MKLHHAAVFLLLAAGVAACSPDAAQAPAAGKKAAAEPVDPEKAFVVQARRAAPGRVVVDFTILPDYYLYRERTSIALQDASGLRIKSVDFPTPTMKNDMSFGLVGVYARSFSVGVELEGSAKAEPTLLVKYQGCFETIGICYPPQEATLKVADATNSQ